MNSRTQSDEVRFTIGSLKVHGWYSDCSVAEVARRMNAAGECTARGLPWNESNLRAKARRHSFSRDCFRNLMPLGIAVDEPGFTEYAHPDSASWLTVTDGMRDARMISRYIEKGSQENRDRLRQAIEKVDTVFVQD